MQEEACKEKIYASKTLRSVSQSGVQLRAVLACAESLKIQYFRENECLKQKQFGLFIRDSDEIKKAKQIL